MADQQVRLAAVANTEENFGIKFDDVFEDKMADHIDTIAGIGKQYFSQDKSFRSALNRSARAAAWRMIRQAEDVAV